MARASCPARPGRIVAAGWMCVRSTGMKAFLDERELGPSQRDAGQGGAGQEHAAALGGVVGRALAAARELAQASGRVIIEVKLDGRQLSDTELEAVEAGAGPSGERLQFVSANPRELVATSFVQAADALEEARDLQTDAGGALQAGDVGAALGLITEVIGVWEAVRAVLERGPGLLGVPLEGLVPSGVNVQARTAELSASLQSVKTSLESQDWSSLADVLAVELDEQNRVWTGLLRQMGQAALKA